MLLATIKADLRQRIEAAFPRAEEEPDYSISIRDCSEFEDELLKELHENVPPKSLPRRMARGKSDSESVDSEDYNGTQDTQDIPETQFPEDNCE